MILAGVNAVLFVKGQDTTQSRSCFYDVQCTSININTFKVEKMDLLNIKALHLQYSI